MVKLGLSQEKWGNRGKGGRKIDRNSLIKPNDSIEIQVVSGLIQHQQCGFHEQCPKVGGRIQGEQEKDPEPEKLLRTSLPRTLLEKFLFRRHS